MSVRPLPGWVLALCEGFEPRPRISRFNATLEDRPMRTIKREDCKITVTAEDEVEPVRGNALVSGNDAEDKACEDEIIRRVHAGDTWAWASVKVHVSCGALEAYEYLGCCSYADEADFRQPGGYYDDMVDTCIDQLNEHLTQLKEKLGA